jgi:hypothetical protein
MFAGFCTTLGWTILILVMGGILLGQLVILFLGGFDAWRETMSPYNSTNIIATLLVLAPGVGFLALGNKIRDKNGDWPPVPPPWHPTTPSYPALLCSSGFLISN